MPERIDLPQGQPSPTPPPAPAGMRLGYWLGVLAGYGAAVFAVAWMLTH